MTQDRCFEDWFEGSVICHPDGTPKQCFHWTEEVFDEFFPNSHFGSLAAALSRCQSVTMGKRSGVTLPVYLSLRNPVRTKDWYEWTDGEFWDDLWHRQIIDTQAYNRICYQVRKILDNHGQIQGVDCINLVAQELKSVGYDGIVYCNEYENEEGEEDSYIVFNPANIRLASHPDRDFLVRPEPMEDREANAWAMSL